MPGEVSPELRDTPVATTGRPWFLIPLVAPGTPVLLILGYNFGCGIVRDVRFNLIQTLTSADIAYGAFCRARAWAACSSYAQ